ncbi:MAG: energy-coupling factor transporter transmembrane protein EcfT [Gloeomargarita sp. SKYBB_i_bin120]|nr:energy-coupling factor transporter transmembrane protein EcfT [Gloeomargarita sp. SKYG98]MCS7292636.1 energy-coupling factor transporter transmembrane protein EcfT [Gloeomargarita sp. SKYB120]MDW8178198.1 energy-coupling factor transporter transmembrane protein EcfT [Gloeomargarita sp. SKYBB_i_bin120]
MDLLRSLPLGLYLESPQTWLHWLDARVKLGWLMALLLTPILANGLWRGVLVALLVALTLLSGLPPRVWRKQLGGLAAFCLVLLVVIALAPDGLAVTTQPRLPSEDGTPPTSYDYVLWRWHWFTVTQRSWQLAWRLSSLFFTLVYATHLYLLTTPSEAIAAAMTWCLQPLRRWGWPVAEISLSLTLALRFIPLVLEEVQNLVRSVQMRGIRWSKLKLRQVIQVWLRVAERLLVNLFLRAEQVATAMVVRGYQPGQAPPLHWRPARWQWGDTLAVLALLGLCGARWVYGGS